MNGEPYTWQPPKLSAQEALASQLQAIDNDYDNTEANKAWRKQKLITEYEALQRKQDIDVLIHPANVKEGRMWAGSSMSDLKPRPLHVEVEPPEFKTDALPEQFRHVVDEIEALTQAPPELIVVSLLPTIAACVQHLADVKRDSHLVGPLSLFAMGLAESGERKSTIDRHVNKGIREWQDWETATTKDARKEYQRKIDVWSAKRQALDTVLKAAVRKNTDTADIEAHIMKLEESKPVPVHGRQLLRVDDTMEALNADLAAYPFAFIQSSEAGAVLGSAGMSDESLMRHLALLNQGWDGFNIPQRRKTVESVESRQVRMSASLQLQPSILAKFQQRSGGMARGIGTFARILLTPVKSTIGDREYREPVSAPHLAGFNQRCAQLLQTRANVGPGGIIANTLVQPDAKAFGHWREFYNAIEDELKPGREYAELKDSASKCAENAARIAASWHTFMNGVQPGGRNEYSYELQRQACIAARYFLDSTLYAFNVLTTPQGVLDAQEAEAWIVARCKSLKTDHIDARDFALNGPWRLRKPATRKEVFAFLDSQNRVFVTTLGTKGGETYTPHPLVRLEYMR